MRRLEHTSCPRTSETDNRDQAGIERDIHPHLFRHTFARKYLCANPKEIETLRDLLGHTSYKQVQVPAIRQAAAAAEHGGMLPDTLL